MRRSNYLILILVLIFSVTTLAFDVYTQDFSGDNLPEDFKVIEGKWKVEEDRLVGESSSGSVQGRVIFGPELEEFVYSVDATYLSANPKRYGPLSHVYH